MKTDWKINGGDGGDAACHLAAVYGDRGTRTCQGSFHTSAAITGGKVHRTIISIKVTMLEGYGGCVVRR